MTTDTAAGRRGAWRLAAAAFCIVAAARIALVLAIAPEIPYYDEWDGVIAAIARPLLAGDFSASVLFAPQNEHVLFWTRLVNWLQLRAAGVQFDNVAVCLASQLGFALLAAALITLGAMHVARWRRAFVLAALLAVVVPYAWENIGMGWGNSYYFLIAFSAAAIVAAATLRSAAALALAPALLAAAAGVAMASGIVAAAAALLALGLRVRTGSLSPERARPAGVALAAAAVLTAFVLPHDHAAATPGALQALELVVAAVLFAPAWSLLRRLIRGDGGAADVAFACIAVWGFLQIVAIVLARPAFRLWFPVSRYVDVLTVAAFANLGCLCRLAVADAWPGAARACRAAFTALFAAIISCAPVAWHWMDARAAAQREQGERLARYIRGGDADALAAAPDAALAYPQRDRLRALADAADVRLILGDRVGTRNEPSPLVARRRALAAALDANASWLLPLALGAGALLLAAALRGRGECSGE